MFLFQRFWVFFRIFNLAGVFPCYRETIEGQKYLRANTGICQLLKYLIFVSLSFVAPIVVGFKNGVTITELFQWFASTSTDKVAFTGIWICYGFESIPCAIILFCIRKDLCMLQDFILEKFLLELPPENVYYNTAVFLWLPFSSLTAILFPLGFSITIADELNYNAYQFSITFLSFFAIILGLFFPILATLLVFYEIFRFVSRWLQKLNFIVADPRNGLRALRECELFCKKWKDIQSMVSFLLFVIMTASVIQVILISYKSLGFFINGEFATNDIVQAVGYFAFQFAMLYSFVFISFYGEKISNQVKELRVTLHDQHIVETGCGKAKSDEMLTLKKLVLNHLYQWENFSGFGFFTIGKPFLTAFVSNFITYLIILVQFKLTEKPIEVSDLNNSTSLNASIIS